MKNKGKNRRYRRKRWRDKRSKKILLRLSVSIKQTDKLKHIERQSEWNTVSMPKIFSLIENTFETTQCFERISNKLRIPTGNTLWLNFSEVEKLTIDAIMYLIAFMQNQNKRGYTKNIRGNLPENGQAKSDMLTSGFMKFVSHPAIINEEQLKKEDTFMITVGETASPRVMCEVREFVDKVFDLPPNYSRFIYTIVGELITNTNDYAYTDYNKPVNRWYLFAKQEKEKIKFTVLDTGLGIPATINKRRLEKLREKISLISDSKYIFEALQGKHKSNISRSKMGEPNRNKGLPAIYNFYKEGKITNLKIISNSGTYYCTEEGEKECELDKKLKGTIFYWEIEDKVRREI